MKLNAMELEFSQNKTIVQNILKQIDNSLELISEWNKTIIFDIKLTRFDLLDKFRSHINRVGRETKVF
jgi:hypothetical protein